MNFDFLNFLIFEFLNFFRGGGGAVGRKKKLTSFRGGGGGGRAENIRERFFQKSEKIKK